MTKTRGPTGKDPIPRSRKGTLSSRLEPDETILVVEDEPDIATFLRAYFRASGQDVVHVDPTSAAQVAGAVAEHRPSCVLLDLNLRGFHGLDAYREIRKSDDNAFVPVVIVTADHTRTMRDEALAAGVDAYVTKPFNIKELCEIVADHVERSSRRAAASESDDATGLGGAAFLQERLAEEVIGAGSDERPVTLALLRLSPVPGVAALQALVAEVAAALPDHAVMTRSADDELGVILPGTAADDAAARLEQALASAEGHGASLRAGVAAWPAHARDCDELYMAADAALADACDSGRLVTIAV